MQGCISVLTPLLVYDTTASKPVYVLQREGLQLLRKYQNNRVRVIFHYACGQLSLRQLIAKWYNNDKLDVKLQQNCLYAIGDADNILNLITLQDNANFILLGYVVSSLIIEHFNKNIGKNQFSQTQIVGFQKKVQKVRCSQLMKQSLYTDGAIQKPNFMWMVHSDSDSGGFQHDVVKNCKKMLGQDQSKSLQELYQNITAFQLPSEGSSTFNITVDGFKNHLTTKLQYRKMVNFDITGGSLHQFMYEMCDAFNDTKQTLALDRISQKSMTNLKNRVVQSVTAKSVNILVEAAEKKRDAPMNVEEMQQMMDTSRQALRKQLSAACRYCFQLPDFLQILDQTTNKLEETYQEIKKSNQIKTQQRTQNLFAQLQVLQTQDISLPCLSQHLLNKITMFSQGCSDSPSIMSLAICLLKQFTFEAEERLQNAMDSIEKLETSNQELEHEIITQRGFSQELQKKYQSNLTGNNAGELQSMRETLSKRQSKNNAYKKQISELKKQLKDKDEQLYAKCNECDEFQDLITFYEGIVGTDKNRQKGKCQLDRLMRNLNENIDRFHRAADRIEKLDDTIKQLKREVDEGKQQVLRENDRLLSEIETLRRQKALFSKEKDRLEESVNKSQEAISIYKQILEYNKNAIDAGATQIGQQRQYIAQMEAPLLNYKKALEKVAQYIVSPNNMKDSLVKFMRSVQQTHIRQCLMRILKK